MCHWLLEEGAELDAVDSSGYTARRLAKSKQRDGEQWKAVYEFLGVWEAELERKRAAQANRLASLRAAEEAANG